MKKIVAFIFTLFLALTLTGCKSRDIPEGDIKNFVENIDYTKTYNAIKTAKGTTKTTYYLNKVEKGSLISQTIIDKDNGTYSYRNDLVTGDYYGDEVGTYPFKHRETLAYQDQNGNGVAYEKTDGKLNNEIKYRPEDVLIAYHNFFYTKLEANYHMGGYYYGDYVKANCAKYYEYFSLNEDKSLLTYKINTLTQNSDNEDILTLHEFTIDKYGMIISLSSTAKNNAKGIKSITTMECEYNIVVDRLVELKDEKD